MDMMELDGFGDVGSLFGIDGLADDFRDVAVMGVSAGASVIVGELLFTKVPMLSSRSTYVQSAIAAGLGIVGGIGVARLIPGTYGKAIGAGVGAGLIGWAVAKSIQKIASLPEYNLKGLGQSDSDLLLGLGQSDSDLLLGLGQSENVAVEDYRPLPGQTNGLGQGAGDVYARDLGPMPGGGYIQGLGTFIS